MRQGNMFEEVQIFRYVTKGTFDAYNWSIIETKQKFISQVMNSNSVGRECEDVDEAVMNYAEMKAIASENPLIKEKMELDVDIQKLKVLRDLHQRNKYEIEKKLKRELPSKLETLNTLLEQTMEDVQVRDTYKMALDDDSKIPIVIQGKEFFNREEAGECFTEAVKNIKAGENLLVGEYCGLEFGLQKDYMMSQVQLKLLVKGKRTYTIEPGESASGNIQRIVNMIQKLDSSADNLKEKIDLCKHEQIQLQMEFEKPFIKEEEYLQKLSRQKELEVLLSQGVEIDESQEPNKKIKIR